MNEPTVPHATTQCNSTRPRFCPSRQDPLKAAQTHNFALRLDLRRARRDLVGSHKQAAVNRLLHVNAAVSRSLAWLRGGPDAIDDGLEEFGQLAIESRAMPDAVGVPQ
jgi:hypothetical protein